MTMDKSLLEAVAPDWLQPGTRVRHTKFGEGTVEFLGTHKGCNMVRILFDSVGSKALVVGIVVNLLTPVASA